MLHFLKQTCLKLLFRNWQDGSVVKETDCQDKGPDLHLQYVHGGKKELLPQSVFDICAVHSCEHRVRR